MVIKGILSWDMAVCHLFSALWMRVAKLARLSLGAVCCVTQEQELARGCPSRGMDGMSVCPPPRMHRCISFRKDLKHH